MNDEALGVANVGEQAVQLEPVDKALAGLQAAVDAEAEDRAEESFPVVLRRHLVRRMFFEARVVHPGDPGMVPQELSDGLSVRRVALHPQGKRLQALQEQEAVEWA